MLNETSDRQIVHTATAQSLNSSPPQAVLSAPLPNDSCNGYVKLPVRFPNDVGAPNEDDKA